MVYDLLMTIGQRLRALRQSRRLTQEDMRKRTGMLRPHISRLENGHTAPSVKTLERIARALEVPINKIFLGVEQSASSSAITGNVEESELHFGRTPSERRLLNEFNRMLAEISPVDRRLLFSLAKKMAQRAK
jgi:transcriptional regulator with XRE-family HTH domain